MPNKFLSILRGFGQIVLPLELAAIRRLLFATTIVIPAIIYAHNGGTDSYGCHNQTSTGTYHCHNGVYNGQSFVSKDAMLADLNGTTTTATSTSTYNRDDYLPDWADADGDCQNTRHEVLIAESRTPVLLNSSGCTVVLGLWADPYTGLSFTNPADVDIDHMVPLKEAHDSGASAWSTKEKRAFANDLSNPLVLIAVDDGTNSSKGDKDPAKWMPPNTAYHCEYVRNWVAIKSTYGLSMDSAEAAYIASILDSSKCH